MKGDYRKTTKAAVKVSKTTQNRETFYLNLSALKVLKIKDGYHVKIGYIKDRIYVTRASRDEKNLAWTIRVNELSGHVMIPSGCRPEFRKFIEDKYGTYYLKLDSKRDMFYIDLTSELD